MKQLAAYIVGSLMCLGTLAVVLWAFQFHIVFALLAVTHVIAWLAGVGYIVGYKGPQTNGRIVAISISLLLFGVAAGGVAVAYFRPAANRYRLSHVGTRVYKLDVQTGQTWFQSSDHQWITVE